MGVEWVCFGRGHFVPEILQKKLAPMCITRSVVGVTTGCGHFPIDNPANIIQ